MKYNKEQYKILVDALKIFNVHFDIESVHPCSLHYNVSQQFNEYQTHNHLYIDNTNKNVVIRHIISDENISNYTKLVNIDFDFKLYPDGCNDNHIETAMKRAIKEIKTSDKTMTNKPN